MKILNKIFKHKHKWKSIITGEMISDGVDEFYKCKCGGVEECKYFEDKGE